MGVSLSQVFADIKHIRTDWRASTLFNFDESTNLELARIDQVELEAWKGWQRTIGKVRTIREEGGRVSGAKSKLPPEKTVTTIETQVGDPFLQTILECVRRRCEILGLNAPVEVRITGRLSIDDLREILEAAEEPEENALARPTELVQ